MLAAQPDLLLENLQSIFVFRLQVEGHVQPGEAALLWRAGEAEQAASGALSRLQVQTPAQTDLHRGGTEAEGGRVQGHDEEPPAGAESDLHAQVETSAGTGTNMIHTTLR